MEKILDIRKTSFKLPNNWPIYDGYEILTDQQTIKLGIQSQQHCCEDYGYFFTNDDITDFIGAELVSIKIVDRLLYSKKFQELGDLYYGDAIFVHFETSQGLLEFVVYNSHNGYYGHDAVIVSKQLYHQKEL